MNNSLIIRIEEIQQACGKILTAVDSNSLSVLTETLQIKTENKKMYISVTNREYLAKVKIDIPEDVEFLATVNANLFLKLVSQITTDTIELSVVDSTLILKGMVCTSFRSFLMVKSFLSCQRLRLIIRLLSLMLTATHFSVLFSTTARSSRKVSPLIQCRRCTMSMKRVQSRLSSELV